MPDGLPLSWAGHEWFADASGALWWPSQRSLLLADLHFGKVGHFRREGVPIPQAAFDKSLRLLDLLLNAYQPDNLIILGDLFHSRYNLELEYFRAWRRRHKGVALQLVPGNHDVLGPKAWGDLGLENLGVQHTVEGVELVHDPGGGEASSGGAEQAAAFRMSGHIHPGVRLVGGGRQSLVLPCFWFGERQALLPAFGAFTGLHRISPGAGDCVLVLAEGKILDVSRGAAGSTQE